MKPHLTLCRDDGTVYLRRWYLLPRSWSFSVYLHQFLGDDDERGLHDHPYNNASLALSRSGYMEQIPIRAPTVANPCPPTVVTWRRPFCLVCRKAEDPHRVLLIRRCSLNGTVERVPCWSLFFRGRRRHDWGFWMPEGWISNSVIQTSYTGYGEETVATRGNRAG